ncbi:MAG: hypothetical protein WCA85_26040 [Paraburkholderia sp.]|uniref:hypothetical protein n=1 Tax=Paraburkholderia sp. TaxID=1926495 RepID=UPI003C4E998D
MSDFIPRSTCTATGGDCFREGRCLRGCKSEVKFKDQSTQIGWKCPVCGKGNAPFQKICANAACGINFSAPACAIAAQADKGEAK